MNIEESLRDLSKLLDETQNEDMSVEDIRSNLVKATKMLSETQENVDKLESLMSELNSIA